MAMITPMNTSGIVLSMRCGQLACRKGEVKIAQMRSTSRGNRPPSRSSA